VATNNNEQPRRKIVLGIIALLAAVSVIIGAGFAFFSDVIKGSGSVTAGTLDITGTVSLKHNGEPVNGDTIANLNPGDLIEIDTSKIVNEGTKSAWIRQVLQFTSISSTPNTTGPSATGALENWLWVCPSGVTQAELIASNGPGPLGCERAITSTVYGEKDSYAAPGDVISGSLEEDGAACETDCAWTPPDLGNIYFDANALNTAQNGNASFTVTIQALQYRNNTDPGTINWGSVVTTPFGL
jgi:predicted ribosomally synthesized peptide with SipW-like signal peptide